MHQSIFTELGNLFMHIRHYNIKYYCQATDPQYVKTTILQIICKL